MSRLPERIVCLTTETVEVLYALGEQARIVGISGYTVRPPQARREKPKVFAFATGDVAKILALRPDLALCFSDMQADIARDLVRAGVAVHVFNQRSVDGILAMVETVGRLVGAEAPARAIVAGLEARMAAARAAAEAIVARAGRRPRVFFEEWDAPLICGIRWVSELIELAGGEDVCATRALAPAAGGRIVADAAEIVALSPDIVIGSWCGKRFRAERVAARPGWGALPAVRAGEVHEIKSATILTPGPAAIEEGLPALQRLFADWAARR